MFIISHTVTAADRCCSLGTPYTHDIAEILLNVALNIISRTVVQ